MKQNYLAISLVLAIGLGSAACSKKDDAITKVDQSLKTNEVASATSPDSTPVFVVENSSPDQAVKSWWKVIDLTEQYNAQECENYRKRPTPSYMQYLGKVTQEDVLRTLSPKKSGCTVTLYEREILEVKTESETRAIIFAKVFNATPIPEGAEPDDYDKKYRKNGFKFKYLVEKTSDGWKVSQVYEFDSFATNGEAWRPIYKSSDKPHYPAYVHRQ